MNAHTAPGRDAAAAAQPGIQVLTFSLGEELFAIDISRIREIIQYGPMTAVPLMPGYVRGVINLRGAVVPVIDLQARFGRPPAAVGKKTCIVIFETEHADARTVLGLLVDAVSEVLELASDSIEPPPNFGSSVRRDFIRGMGRMNKRFVILLEPDRAFDVAEMAAAEEAGAVAAGVSAATAVGAAGETADA